MSIREIPKSYEYSCDLCGAVHVQRNANGQYTNSTPPDWLLLRMDSNGKRFSYPAEPMRKLLCTTCGERTLQAIERVEPAALPEQTP